MALIVFQTGLLIDIHILLLLTATFFTFFNNLTRFLARFFGEGKKTINTVYSTTRTEKYSVRYYSDGKIYYTVLFLKKVIVSGTREQN